MNQRQSSVATPRGKTTNPRRHDLDALRGFAMLLGIALHAGLSLTPFPWPVQDTRQSEWYGLLFAAVHGFRMPLFFLLSGFFTAMLWRSRGLKALLSHRLRRVLLPLLLGMVTVVPAVSGISALALADGLGASADGASEDTIWSAAARGDIYAIDRHLDAGAHPDTLEPAFGTSPLATAALFGHRAAVAQLLARGAAIDRRNRDGSTALHAAAFLGRIGVAELLVEHGAGIDIENDNRMVAAQSADVDWSATTEIAGWLQIEIDEAQVNAGRRAVIELLAQHVDQASSATAPAAPAASEDDLIPAALFNKNILYHLWFMWFLCWLVCGFVVCALVAERVPLKRLPAWTLLSPARYLWLVPLTMVPQSYMGLYFRSFGPDTSFGLLPLPHVLLFYALFFGFGALYFTYGDEDGRLGKYWRFELPFGLLVVFPLGLEFSTGAFGFAADWLAEDDARLVAVGLQAAFTWLLSFALMGAFRHYLSSERYKVRYLSDASYWLYIAHVPLIIGAQLLVRDWPLPSLAKFALICCAVTGLLLLVYHTLVRYRWLGTFLNGPRTRPDA